MNALPGAYLTWTTSVEPLTSFLRYLVYRRKTGDTAYTRVGRITDRSLTSFQDYTLASGVSYDYAVTQVSSASGEEVESTFPTAATASVTIRSTFIHDVAAPANYVEILAEGQSVSPEQDVAYLQVWGRNQPTAHFPLLVGMEAHGDPMTAFKDVDYALLIGSRPRGRAGNR